MLKVTTEVPLIRLIYTAFIMASLNGLRIMAQEQQPTVTTSTCLDKWM